MANPKTNSGIALDVHAHLVPIRQNMVGALEGVLWRDGILSIDGHALRAKGLFHPHELLTWMDTHSVSRAWVSIPPPTYRQHLGVTAAREWLRYLADGLDEICANHADRLAPLHYLPLEHPDLALEIASDVIGQSHPRFCLAAGGNERIVYSDPVFEPLWSLLDSASSFVFMHPGRCCDGRLGVFYLDNLVGNPHETAVAVSHLIFGGVCDRYKRIRFCLAHGGGTVPMLAGRLSRGYETRRPDIDTEHISDPAITLRRFMADCIVHDTVALASAAHVFGDEHVLFGSDWPFPMGIIEPEQQLDTVSAPLRGKITRSNAYALLDCTFFD